MASGKRHLEKASGRRHLGGGHLGWHTDQGASISTARTLQAKACLGKVYIYIYIYIHNCHACPGSYTNVRKGFCGGVAVARLNQRCSQTAPASKPTSHDGVSEEMDGFN